MVGEFQDIDMSMMARELGVVGGGIGRCYLRTRITAFI